MCFSLQVSIYAFVFIIGCTIIIFARQRKGYGGVKDKWATVVILSAAFIQLMDAIHWLDVIQEGKQVDTCTGFPASECTCTGDECFLYNSTTTLNKVVTIITGIILAFQPPISLLAAFMWGKIPSVHKLVIWIPYLAYFIAVLIGIAQWDYTRISESGKLLWGGSNIGPESGIIHTVLLVFPFVYAKNDLSKYVWILVVVTASFASYMFTDAFGSMWCFFTVIFSLAVLMDPYLDNYNKKERQTFI